MNQFTYFLLPSGRSDEADARYSVLLRCAVWHRGMCQVHWGLWAHFYIKPVVRNNHGWTENQCCWKVYTKHRPGCFGMVFNLIWPITNGWVTSPAPHVNIKAVGIEFAYQASAIVLHMWRLSVDYTLTPHHWRKKCQGDGSHLPLRWWETRQGRSARIMIPETLRGGRISVHPPLCHPHLADHVTNRASS